MDDRASVLKRRFQTALALHDDGVAIMRQNLSRRHPDATEKDLDNMLQRWLRTRPDVGDAHGRPRRLPG